MKVKGKIYETEVVENKNKKVQADSQYVVCVLEHADGSTDPLLFTDFDILKALKRARANPEDLPAPTPTLFERFIGWFN